MSKSGLWLLSCLLACTPLSAAEVDPLLKAARTEFDLAKNLETINLLENALLKDPQNEEYWVELIGLIQRQAGLCGNSVPYYYLAARQHHPNSLPIRWAWMRCLSAGAALDELAELEKLEPNKELINNTRELLHYGLRVPRDWKEDQLFANWTAKLIQDQKTERAAEIMKQGLSVNPKNQALQQLQVITLASEGKLDEALKLHKSLGNRQPPPFNQTYPTLADYLLKAKRYKDVVAVLGPKQQGLAPTDRLILGQAHLMLDQPAKAEAVLEKADLNVSKMLLIALMLEKNLDKEAATLAESVMDKWPVPSWEHAPLDRDMKYRCNWPTSLEPYLRKSLTWLWEKYPERHRQISFYLASPQTLFTIPSHIKPTLPCSEVIDGSLARLKALNGRLDPHNSLFGTLGLFTACREAHRSAEAVAQAEQLMNQALQLGGQCAVCFADFPLEFWSRFQRDELARNYYPRRFTELVAIRRLITNLLCHPDLVDRYSFKKIAHQEWLTPDEIVKEVAARGPVALALVYPLLTINNEEPLNLFALRMIGQAGTSTDVPFLLVKFHNYAKFISATQDAGLRARQQQYGDLLLKTLAGAAHETAPDSSLLSQKEHYVRWWNRNHQNIYAGAEHEHKQLNEQNAKLGK